MEHHGSWPARLVHRMGRALRSDKQYSQAAIDQKNQKEAKRRKLQKPHARMREYGAPRRKDDLNEMGEREYSVFSQAPTLIADKPLDHTEMMHGLAHYDSQESLRDDEARGLFDTVRDPYLSNKRKSRMLGLTISFEHERRIASLPEEVWARVASFLNPLDAANLAFASKTLLLKLGAAPFDALREPGNRAHRVRFLHQFDRRLPDHLFCFQCLAYHRRIQMGRETLKADFVNNPLFFCPSVKRSVLPRMRLVYGRELPYAFVQLATRRARYGPDYGIDVEQLARRWKCKASGWSHRTRYMLHAGRLLMRVVSSTIAPPAAVSTETSQRHLLYDREEYTPFFSVCAHWRDGDLTSMCKCALSHVPSPPESYAKQLQRGLKLSRAVARPNFIVRGCDDCRPARRCPECPTEYLAEIQMVEDAADPNVPFKHAIIVTRWSDLGDGRDPLASPEWRAINGIKTPEGEAQPYGSFETVGRRAVGGIFESAISGTVPGQRLISLNPRNKKLGEDGNGWY